MMIIDGLRLWIQTNEAVKSGHSQIVYVQVICDYCHFCIKAGHNTTGLTLAEIVEAATQHEHAQPGREAARIEEQAYVGFSKHRRNA